MAIDLEHFPTSKTALRMMDRISPIYGRSYVGKWIFQVMGLEMDEARDLFLALRDEAFPERTTWTIGYWERRYAIIPKPTETMEERRRNIKMRQSVFLPMNPTRLEGIVDGLTGGNTTVTENVDDYTFSVTVENPGPGADTINVLKEIKKRKPSHQNFRFCVTITAKTPITFHLGGGVGAQTLMSVPMEPDTYNFEDALYAGGAFAGRTEMGVPAEADTYGFTGRLHTGGAFAGGLELPVPEDLSQPSATTILRTGGVCTIISNLSGKD